MFKLVLNNKFEYPRVLLAGFSILDAELTVTQLTSYLFSFEIISYDTELKAIIEANISANFDDLLTELTAKYISKVLETKKAHVDYGYRMH